MENKHTQDRSKVYLIAIIVILLLMNAFFIYHYVSTDKELTVTTEELTDVQGAKDEIDLLLKESQDQLNSYKGKNAQLDSLIEEKNREIQAKAQEIRGLLKDKKAYAAAMEELEKLRYYVKKYQDEISTLTTKNEKLQQQNKEITATLKEEKDKNENLTMKNITLENKVTLGKKLSFTAFNVLGINKRGSGRETETTRAKRVDLIKITFTLDKNYVADLGAKNFYLRIITPSGTTLSNETMGGGKLVVGGEEYLYSMKHEIEFDNTGQTATFYYDKGSEWEKGTYTAEIYADGFQIGSQSLEFR